MYMCRSHDPETGVRKPALAHARAPRRREQRDRRRMVSRLLVIVFLKLIIYYIYRMGSRTGAPTSRAAGSAGVGNSQNSCDILLH